MPASLRVVTWDREVVEIQFKAVQILFVVVDGRGFLLSGRLLRCDFGR
jgi:hypothetical protein